MRTASLMLALLAALHFVLISTPCFAQGAQGAPPVQTAQPVQPTRSAPVQPVPYTTSQPVQYGIQPQPVPVTQAPAPTVATATTPDTIVLKNGGMLRGTLVELLPNDHATIQLPSGQSAIVQWGEIHHVERGVATAPATPVAPTGPVQRLPNTTAPIVGPTVLLHIESSRPVTLDRRNPGEDQPWVTACESPCDVQLPLNNDYRIVGEGIWASSEFELEGQPGQRVVVKVAPATRFARTAGIIVASAGLLAIIIGAYVVALATSASCASSNINRVCQDNSGGTTVGVVLMLGGLVTMAVGGIVVIANWRTGESQEVQSPVGKAAWLTGPPRVAGNDAWKRVPSFRELGAMDKLAPLPTTLPLFSGSF